MHNLTLKDEDLPPEVVYNNSGLNVIDDGVKFGYSPNKY